MISQLEQNIGQHISMDGCMVLWVFRHVSRAHYRQQPYKGEATGFERTTGRAYETKIPQLGEMVFALIPVDKGA